MAKYAETAADITDAYTGEATQMLIADVYVTVEGTLADTETALKAATSSGSLANFSELEQAWILGAADADYGFMYWKKRAPVRATPAQVAMIHKIKSTAPEQRSTTVTPLV